jgi:hypothetical protein
MLGLFPTQPPGLTFTELVKAARSQGFSKQAFARHLKRFVDPGLVIHPKGSTFYYRNPLGSSDIEITSRFSVTSDVIKGMTASLGPPLKTYSMGEFYKMLDSITSVWDRKSGVPSLRKGELGQDMEIAVVFALTGYMTLLEAVEKAKSLDAAREVANIVFLAQVKPWLMFFARQVWESRKETSLQELHGKVIKMRIRKRVPAQEPASAPDLET